MDFRENPREWHIALVVLILICGVAWTGLVIHNVRKHELEIPTLAKTFEELVGPQHCRSAKNRWGCMTDKQGKIDNE